MSEENLNKKFEEEFNKLSEKDKREVNNLIRFMHEKKYHDSQYEELLNQYIELSREYDKLENIIKEVREDLDKQITFCSNEANGTTNDKYCKIAINYLKHLKDKLDKGE